MFSKVSFIHYLKKARYGFATKRHINLKKSDKRVENNFYMSQEVISLVSFVTFCGKDFLDGFESKLSGWLWGEEEK